MIGPRHYMQHARTDSGNKIYQHLITFYVLDTFLYCLKNSWQSAFQGIRQANLNLIDLPNIDGDKLNNSYDNLVIGTHRDNMLDVPIQDRINRSLKSAETTRRFSEEELASIVVDRRSGMSYKDICEKYDVGKSWCSYFFNKKTYITFNRETLKFN